MVEGELKGLKERFDAKWKLDELSGCWSWKGAFTKPSTKYEYRRPQISVFGKRRNAHKVAWELYKGEVSAGAFVLHSCNNSMCVNPEHLYLGTQSDNMRDLAIGLRSSGLKISPDDVLAIRSGELSLSGAAKKLGISRRYAAYIRCGMARRYG